jgi:alanyl-tRNA synthetase
VNGWIEANDAGAVRQMGYREAIDAGAIAMFTEKYGDRVRVVSFGSVSTELCGGTHAKATGDIGLLQIVSQSGIAAGVRRIEALTGLGALRHVRERERTLRRVGELLRVAPQQAPERVEKLLEERKEKEREIAELRRARHQVAGAVEAQAPPREIAGVRVLVREAPGADGKELRTLVDDLRGQLKSGVVLVTSTQDGRVSLALGVTPDLRERFQAGELVRELAAIIGGKGGGRPDFAQAGGTLPDKLDEAVERLYALLAGGTA